MTSRLQTVALVTASCTITLAVTMFAYHTDDRSETGLASATGRTPDTATGLEPPSSELRVLEQRTTANKAPDQESTDKPAKSEDQAADTPVKLPARVGAGPAGSLVTTGLKAVALTFDDGPDPKYTPEILDILRDNGVKATFCVVGVRARAHPELIKRIVAEGHSLCNHSWQHRLDLGQQSPDVIRKDLSGTNEAIRRAVPDAKIGYFRAPGGNYDHGLVSIATDMGMTSLYWGVDTQDWNSARYGHGNAMRHHIVSVVEKNTRPGSIVLAHDLGKPDTIAAYRTLLPSLKDRFSLIPLPA